MKIVHFTNTFLPHVGGVARAVQTLLETQRSAGHRVLVVAPKFDLGEVSSRIERSVVRVNSITHFNSTDFAVRLPLAARFSRRLGLFRAQVIHAHHPFLLGDTALREAARRRIPVVFTHHTLYENYTHYLPIEGDTVGEFAADVATRFANRCHAAIAPSASVKELMVQRGVTVPIHVIPTGIDFPTLQQATGSAWRKKLGWGPETYVVGHLGRFAAEKNLAYLATSLIKFLQKSPRARVLLVGDGPERSALQKQVEEAGVAGKVHFTGLLKGKRLREALAAMDLFAFASHSETQGLVLVEAMATGMPVVALDASGSRDVVIDGENGRLLPANATEEEFAAALLEGRRYPARRRSWAKAAVETARGYDRERLLHRQLTLYTELIEANTQTLAGESKIQAITGPVRERLALEGQLWVDRAAALVSVLAGGGTLQQSGEPA